MQNESELAKNLLRIRDKGFPPLSAVFLGRERIQVARCFLLVVLVFWLVVLWSDAANRAFLFGLLGFLSGAIFNETMFLKRIRANWGFTRKVTNWELVERLAEATPQPPALPDAK